MSERQRTRLATQAAAGNEKSRQDLLCSLASEEGNILSARERLALYLATSAFVVSSIPRRRR